MGVASLGQPVWVGLRKLPEFVDFRLLGLDRFSGIQKKQGLLFGHPLKALRHSF